MEEVEAQRRERGLTHSHLVALPTCEILDKSLVVTSIGSQHEQSLTVKVEQVDWQVIVHMHQQSSLFIICSEEKLDKVSVTTGTDNMQYCVTSACVSACNVTIPL